MSVLFVSPYWLHIYGTSKDKRQTTDTNLFKWWLVQRLTLWAPNGRISFHSLVGLWHTLWYTRKWQTVYDSGSSTYQDYEWDSIFTNTTFRWMFVSNIAESSKTIGRCQIRQRNVVTAAFSGWSLWYTLLHLLALWHEGTMIQTQDLLQKLELPLQNASHNSSHQNWDSSW